MAVEHGEDADGDGKVLAEDFEPGFDPGLAVRHALAAEKSPAHAARNAVVVAGDGDVYQLPPGHRLRRASCRIRGTERPYPTAPAAGRQRLCLFFWLLVGSQWVWCAARPRWRCTPCSNTRISARVHTIAFITCEISESKIDYNCCPK